MRWRSLLNPGYIALAVLSVAAAILLVPAIQKQNALYRPAETLPPSAPPVVAFVGGPAASGTDAGGLGPAHYSALLASRNGWTATDATSDGAGYVAAPQPGATFGGALPRVVGADPELVVVAGSAADRSAEPDDVRAAAERLYAELRAALPGARVIVVGPIRPDGESTRSVRAVRDAVRDAAGAARLPFVDPITEEWFAAAGPGLVTPDGEQLTDRGHERLAELVGAAIERHGGLPR